LQRECSGTIGQSGACRDSMMSCFRSREAAPVVGPRAHQPVVAPDLPVDGFEEIGSHRRNTIHTRHQAVTHSDVYQRRVAT
jgi:hypothetical protein